MKGQTQTNESGDERPQRVPDRLTGRSLLDTAPSSGTSEKAAGYGIDSHASSVTLAPEGQRVGKHRLDTIRMSLTARDQTIIASLKQHRFLSTHDLQRWHFSAHASALTAARTSRRVLARLKELGVIDTLSRRLGGVTAGSSQHVWHLTPVGERLAARGSGRRIREPSPAFLDHELGVARVHLDLIGAEREKRLRLIDFTTEPRCWRTFPGASGQVVTLKPDFFSIIGANDTYESLVFGEYDRGTESVKTIAKKASVYESYWRTGLEERRSGAFPTVLWIAPDEHRITRIREELGRTARLTMALHDFTTPDKVVTAITEEGGEERS